MALVQNTWFPNALRREPGQTIYGATPWQTMQQAYQQPQNQLASNAVVGQPIAQQTYQPTTIKTLPDLSPVQSTVRPPGTMPMLASQQISQPPVDTGGGVGGGEDRLPPGYTPPPVPTTTPTTTPTTPSTGGTVMPSLPGPYDPTGQNVPTTPANLGYKWVWNPMTSYWMQVIINEPSKPRGGTDIPGPETSQPPVPTGGAIPEPGYPPTVPNPTPTLNPYSWGDPRYGRLDAPVWDWSQGPPSASQAGGFWIRPPWAERNSGANTGNYVDTMYVPEGMTFGQFLAANPWFYNRAGSAGAEQVRDMRMKQYIENLLAEIQQRASSQYQYRPGAIGAGQVANMTPSEREMLMGQWESMGLSGDDMWSMMLAAMPKGNAQTMTRWG